MSGLHEATLGLSCLRVWLLLVSVCLCKKPHACAYVENGSGDDDLACSAHCMSMRFNNAPILMFASTPAS